jgi:hypothetical protein
MKAAFLVGVLAGVLACAAVAASRPIVCVRPLPYPGHVSIDTHQDRLAFLPLLPSLKVP